MTLTGDNRVLLDAILDQLIPANPARNIPAAGESGTGAFIEAQATRDRDLNAALETLLSRAAKLADRGTPSSVRQLEHDLPVEFSKLLVMTYMGYYSRPEIRARVGVGAHAGHPAGYDVAREPPDLIDALTAPVRARGKAYRDA